MRKFVTWIMGSGARIAVVFLTVALVYFVTLSHQRGRDLERVCALLGPHDHENQAVTVERRAIDAICLGQEADDDL